MKTILQLLACYLALWGQSLQAQNKTELNQGWKCSSVSAIKENGTDISVPSYSLEKWMPATVPGTVLTTLLNNKKVPDPFYGMNNKNIPDIYQTGREHYTYWFAKDFNENSPATGQQIWLHFRGVNYGCDIYLNGHKLNSQTHYGMFLRQTYNITTFLRKDGHNRLAVLVWPPDPVGNPNGGQGGDGTIARNNTHQYVAGWDWIQPIRDRNTGIWDKVTLQKTLAVKIKDPHVITLVHGIRNPIGPQDPVLIKVSATLENPTSSTVDGILQYTLADQKISKKVRLSPHSNLWINFDDLTLKSPKLWWPNGYGPQNLYPLQLKFLINGTIVSDAENVTVGIREIQATSNPKTHSKQIAVNGQKIFIKGGNWIISDAMLRLSDERYDAEVHFHRDMNLNLIRVWGGALIERPEFYAACDKYGLLVFQDFGFSGDCNGRWTDPKKLEDQWTRRAYPGDHALFLESASDQIKMIRNHPSLAIWCGGNEIAPPADILHALKDSILPKLDGTRWFVNYSNADDMSLNTIGDNGDGPYGVQQINTFWGHRTWPFNSEIGSVGVGDYESLTRFMPKENLIAPEFSPETGHKVDSVWQYHRYIGYDASIAPYGNVKDIKDFCMKAQLVNYDQYRALIEGFSSHMWEWYTGVMIWKTQNPWTALRGQMYDYYLDPNACLYGLRKGSEPLHVMYNPIDGMVMIANNTFEAKQDLMLIAKAYDSTGKDTLISQMIVEIGPSMCKKYYSTKKLIDQMAKDKGAFLSLRLLNMKKEVLSENLYWFANEQGQYSGIQQLHPAKIELEAKQIGKDKIEVVLSNPDKRSFAFFNRISLVDPQTHERILPAFYSDNYVTILPGEQKKVIVEYCPQDNQNTPEISVSGWNVNEMIVPLSK